MPGITVSEWIQLTLGRVLIEALDRDGQTTYRAIWRPYPSGDVESNERHTTEHAAVDDLIAELLDRAAALRQLSVELGEAADHLEKSGR